MPAPSPDTLYLIDGSGYIFRAFHALPNITRSDGTPIGAVYGFCNMLLKLLEDLQAHNIAVIFDASRKTFRNEIYPDYKAHRPPPPPELIPQFALIRETTRAFGIPAIEAQNYEADDLIAAYAREAVTKGLPVRIVSADKDLMQLIRDGVELFDPLKSIPIGPAEVLAKFGVSPDKVIDVQALAGDSTDNIPGVPGIGVKTAAQLIEEYGDLETLLARAGEIKQPKKRELLQTHAEQARISKRLVTLDEQAPLPVPLAELKARTDHHAELIAYLQAQGFRSVLARLKAPVTTSQQDAPQPAALPPQPEANKNYRCIQKLEDLQPYLTTARDQGYLAIDTETSSLTACSCDLIGVSLAVAPGEACYIPIGHIDPDAAEQNGGFDFAAKAAPPQIQRDALVAALRDILLDPAVLKIAHNLKYDLQVLWQVGLDVAPYDDTMLLSYVLGAGAHGHGLDELAQRHFQHTMISFDDVTKTGRNRITFDRVPLDKATDYAAEDADYTLRLWQILKPQVAQQHLMRVYERLERPIVPVVAQMETDGVMIDSGILQQQSAALAERMARLETDIHQLAGHPFNVGSPKQMGDVLFGELGLPGGVKGKTGAYSTNVDVLEPLAEAGHEIVVKILEWRGVAKLKSTYTDALPQQIDRKTGRVHTSFSLVGTSTGRLASTHPNLQNIPIRTEDGRAIRRAFVAAEGYELLSVDYSQIELRLAAEAAGINGLIQAFHDGIDIHALTASQVMGIPLADIKPEQRRAAKATNFGIIYGISGFGLAKQIGTTPAEAGAFIKQYLDRFHELRDWMEATKEFARQHGYVETMFGRRIHIRGIKERNAAIRNGAERQAINAPLQGTAADIMKRAMIQLPPALQAANLSAKMLLQVHDELVFEVPVTELEATANLVKQVMRDAPLPSLQLRVPLIAESGHAKSWAEAH